MTRAERRVYNQRRHAEQQRERMADRGAQGVAEMWWDQARRIAKDRAALGDEQAWHDLARTLTNFCDRYSE